MDKIRLTAPCGLDCFNCPVYEGNITEDIKKQVSESLNIPIEETSCKGCRDEKGKCKFAVNNKCATWDCVQEKGVTYCYECKDFPCEMLMPTLDGAQFPQNLKVYNLCRIKLYGIDNWIKESKEIRKKYFEGKFLVGKGPVLEE